LQLTQGPLQAVLQQIPSAQKLEAHWDEAVQTAPRGLRPQLPATHFTFPAQSASEAQVAKQPLLRASQLKGWQVIEAPDAQVPLPSHTRMPATVAPAHVPGSHTVPGS
jgi:hypothetical protein